MPRTRRKYWKKSNTCKLPKLRRKEIERKKILPRKNLDVEVKSPIEGYEKKFLMFLYNSEGMKEGNVLCITAESDVVKYLCPLWSLTEGPYVIHFSPFILILINQIFYIG